MSYLLWFLISLILSAALTPLIKRLAFKFKVLDYPSAAPRKIHNAPMPLLGGLAVFGAFLITITAYILIAKPDFNIVPLKFFLGVLLGGALLMVGGFFDDKYNLSPKISWLFPAIASFIIVFSGIGVGIKHISNPFGNPISLDYLLWGIPLSGIVMFLWLMGMIYTTKFLDGLDGLTSGIA